MKQFLNLLVLSISLVGCVHEVDRSIFTERPVVNEESNCRERHRFCRENCLTQNPYSNTSRQKCFDNCEYRLTSCITSSSPIIQREPTAIVESYAPVYVDPYPNTFFGPYTYWGGRGYYHHDHFHGHRFR